MKTLKLPLWRLTYWRRRLFEAVGSQRYSQASFGNMQNDLHQRLGPNGFFVEAGAVDGFFESNTYFLERFCGWQGILIEPIPEMFQRIATNRPSAMAYNCALVPFDFSDTEVHLQPAHAMSHVVTSAGSKAGPSIAVPARTLNSILLEVAPPQIDLLSLDVEGFEIDVLKGLDFEAFAPQHILLECLTDQAKQIAIDFLTPRYQAIEQLTHRDMLFRLNG